MGHRIRDSVEFFTTELSFSTSGPKPGKVSERYIHDMIPPKDMNLNSTGLIRHSRIGIKPNFAIDRDYFLL